MLENSRETCIEGSKGKMNTKIEKSEKTICFSREFFSAHINEEQKNGNPLFLMQKNRFWRTLAAPVAANSGKKTCDFLM